MTIEIPCYRMYNYGPASYDPQTNMTFIDVDKIQKEFPENHERKAYLILLHENDHRQFVYTHYLIQMGLFNYQSIRNFFDQSTKQTKKINSDKKIMLFSTQLMNSHIFHYTDSLMEAITAFGRDVDNDQLFDLKSPPTKFKLGLLGLMDYDNRHLENSERRQKVTSMLESTVKENKKFRDSILKTSEETKTAYEFIQNMNSVTGSIMLTYKIFEFILNPQLENVPNPLEKNIIIRRFGDAAKNIISLSPTKDKFSQSPLLKELSELMDSGKDEKIDYTQNVLKIYQELEKITKLKGRPFSNGNYNLENILHPKKPIDKLHEQDKIFVNISLPFNVTEDSLEGYVKAFADLFNYSLKRDLLTIVHPFVLAKINDTYEFHFNEKLPQSLIRFWMQNWFRTALFNQLIYKKEFDYDLFELQYRNRKKELEPVSKLLSKDEKETLEKIESQYHDVDVPSEENTRLTIINPFGGKIKK